MTHAAISGRELFFVTEEFEVAFLEQKSFTRCGVVCEFHDVTDGAVSKNKCKSCM